MKQSLFPRNVVYLAASGQIISVHQTPVRCGEALSDHYHGRKVGDRNDRLWSRIYVPSGTQDRLLVGSTLSDWKEAGL